MLDYSYSTLIFFIFGMILTLIIPIGFILLIYFLIKKLIKYHKTGE